MITANDLVSELECRGYVVDLRDVVKNSIHMTGLSVKNNATQMISPCVYIDRMLNDFDNASYAADKVETIISKCNYPDIDLEKLTTREYLLPNVFIAIQRKSEQQLVKRDTPFEDIEEYTYISGANGSNDTWSIKLTHTHLKLANITEEEIWNAAEHNTFNETEISIEGIESVLTSICGVDYAEVPEMPTPMYVVSNRSKHHGAVQIFNQELHKWAKKHGYSSLIVLPSSLHETIVIPNDNNMSLDDLDSMIQEINATQVPPVDQLGDHSYVMNIAA